MRKSLIILGRQPALGLAELESLFGADAVTPFGEQAALLDAEATDIHFARLGGAIKLCSVIATGNTTDFSRVQKLLTPKLSAFASLPESGKITLGLSAYGLKISKEKLFAAGLTLKKQLRNSDRSVRLVPLTEGTHLNSAQVLHNKLLTDSGREIVFVSDGRQTICAETVDEQNLDSYTRRDRERPKRDARVGMLPPKLAQIIINLSGTQPFGNLWDPFCGTGVLLQEALLMGIDVYGSDLEPRMIEYSKANLEWLSKNFGLHTNQAHDIWYDLQVVDATTVKLESKHAVPIQHIACETYLGRPFTTKPNPEILTKTVGEVNLILKKFLQNINTQLDSGTRLCLGVPAWQISSNQFKHLPLIDQLESLGYNRVSFEHVRDEDLLYYREDQIVARELLVITRK
jgi:tRNA G10  N-methylase Trm11